MLNYYISKTFEFGCLKKFLSLIILLVVNAKFKQYMLQAMQSVIILVFVLVIIKLKKSFTAKVHKLVLNKKLFRLVIKKH